ncbi:hypothetical protein D8674_009102 [Pyrus ussuriensis x Pyrus communis]|uniref:Uncharacterized protein n=1 Tax=Pyrus ussuriensis x Pyrus communis TaxID=2448454 RepID=A0A5N5HXQ7_9ROSA|nr:hypothetical protein D8674_009102 [Pyrus ussuriensis x Pyrus communis]
MGGRQGGRIGGSISSRVFWDSCSLQRERWENSMASSGFLSHAEREMGDVWGKGEAFLPFLRCCKTIQSRRETKRKKKEKKLNP